LGRYTLANGARLKLILARKCLEREREVFRGQWAGGGLDRGLAS
jgi:hypothetical protein